MKKLIIMLAVLCCTGIFADTPKFLGWYCKDKTSLETAIKSSDANAYQKISYAVNLKYLENANSFKTYAELKTFIKTKATEFKLLNLSNYELTVIAATQVFCRSWFNKFDVDAFNDCKNTEYGIYFVLNNRTQLSSNDVWNYMANYLTKNNYPINSYYLTRVINFMLNNDLSIDKTEKIKVYSLLYEKYMIKLIDEQNLAADKKVYTPILGKIALKLKVLGVNVAK